MKNAQPFDFQPTLTRAESIIRKIASPIPGNGSYSHKENICNFPIFQL